MPALVAGIHVLAANKNVDGRDKPGHDEVYRMYLWQPRCARLLE
jgi:hypothetical protein